MRVVILATVLASVNAACPNSCSGHGTCGTNEVCTCYDGWGMGGSPGGDCSDRFCPYELAWVDAPTKDGSTHMYAECAAKGICDRETGQCECFGGFEGKGCGRQSCPDGCSGHGTCEYMNELAFGTVYNDYYDSLTTAYSGIGVGAVRPSTDFVCDSGWTGINCASKMCPYGNDIMDERADTSDTRQYQVQTIHLYAGGSDGGGGKFTTSKDALDSQSFALKFTSMTNETFATVPVVLTADNFNTLATDVEAALESLPNGAINDVSVSSKQALVYHHSGTPTGGKGIEIKVTFTGTSVEGNQNLLEVLVDRCGAGCTPRVDGLPLVSHTNTTSYVKQTTAADYNSFECGRRGKCDLDTGTCTCFEGYTGEACGTLTALV